MLRAELLSTVRGVAVCIEDMLRSTAARPLLSLGLSMDVEWVDGTEDVEPGDALTSKTQREKARMWCRLLHSVSAVYL